MSVPFPPAGSSPDALAKLRISQSAAAAPLVDEMALRTGRPVGYGSGRIRVGV